MRCLVTGAAGFIGSHLTERLLAEGHEVWGIDNFADFYARVIKERNLEGPRAYDRFALIEEDLLHLDLMPLLEGIDWVFHLAAQAGVRGSWGSDFTRYLDCNVLATQRLLEAVANQPCVRRFVYASSSSVYGETRCLPIQECTLPQPHSPYGDVAVAKKGPLCYHSCNACSNHFGRRTDAKDGGNTTPQLPHPLARCGPAGCAALAGRLPRSYQCHGGCPVAAIGCLWDAGHGLCL